MSNINLQLTKNDNNTNNSPVSEYGMHLLWKNPDPTSGFSTQTVTILGDYQIYRVYAYFSTESHSIAFRDFFEDGMTYWLLINGIYTPSGKGYTATTYRHCYKTGNEFSFTTTEMYFTGNSSTITQGDNYCIPAYIFGFNYYID